MEVHDRLLSPRQKLRAGAAFFYAVDEIAARLMAGDKPRDDDFFEERAYTRPPSEELLEGVLLRAASEYEEKKVRYLGALYASFVFCASTTPASAQAFLRIAETLTYPELLSLVLIHEDSYRDQLSELQRLQRRYGRVHFGRLIQLELAGVESEGRMVSPQGGLGGYDFASLDLVK